MKINEIVVESSVTLSSDIPNEEWLEDAVSYAIKKGKNEFGVPYMGKWTGNFVGGLPKIPVSILKRLKGMRGEQENVRHADLAAIKKIMQDTGKLPLVNGKEYAPFVMVAWDGSAWVNEGNHRIMAAAELGWDSLPVEIRYFDGGERMSGPLEPKKIIQKMRST